jgi:hypothetical protein
MAPACVPQILPQWLKLHQGRFHVSFTA